MRLGIGSFASSGKFPSNFATRIHFTAVHFSPFATTGHAPWSEPGSNVYASVSDQKNTASPATLRTGTPLHLGALGSIDGRAVDDASIASGTRTRRNRGFACLREDRSPPSSVSRQVHEHGGHPLPPALGARVHRVVEVVEVRVVLSGPSGGESACPRRSPRASRRREPCAPPRVARRATSCFSPGTSPRWCVCRCSPARSCPPPVLGASASSRAPSSAAPSAVRSRNKYALGCSLVSTTGGVRGNRESRASRPASRVRADVKTAPTPKTPTLSARSKRLPPSSSLSVPETRICQRVVQRVARDDDLCRDRPRVSSSPTRRIPRRIPKRGSAAAAARRPRLFADQPDERAGFARDAPARPDPRHSCHSCPASARRRPNARARAQPQPRRAPRPGASAETSLTRFSDADANAVRPSESPERVRPGPSSSVRTLKVMNVAHAKHSAATNHGKCAPPGAMRGVSERVGWEARAPRPRAIVSRDLSGPRSRPRSVRNREKRRATRRGMGKRRARTAAPVRPTSRASFMAHACASRSDDEAGSCRRLAVLVILAVLVTARILRNRNTNAAERNSPPRAGCKLKQRCAACTSA